MVNFYSFLLIFLLMPAIICHFLGVHRFFPTVFMQLIFGAFLANIDIKSYVDVAFLSSLSNDRVVLDTLENFGWFGIAIIIAFSSSEVAEHSKISNDKRFAVISIVGFIFTFSINFLLTYFIVGRTSLLLGAVGDKILFAVTVALGLSVTAVPVLIVMVKSMGISEKIRHTVVGAALMDDLWLWLGLAMAMVYLPSSKNHPAQIAALLVLFLLCMFLVVKPMLAKFTKSGLNINHSMILVASVIFSSAYVTNSIGLHAIFGVFVAGVIFPPHILYAVRPHFEEIANVIFIPLFFALSGMKIQLDYHAPLFWQFLAFFTVVAIFVKFAVVSSLSRQLRFSWRESLTIGGLAQCKGLMELVVANVLLSAGIISPLMFSILSILALLSTLITMPFMRLLGILPSHADFQKNIYAQKV